MEINRPSDQWNERQRYINDKSLSLSWNLIDERCFDAKQFKNIKKLSLARFDHTERRDEAFKLPIKIVN